MLELIQITNDPDLARRCDELAGMRLWVDLERHGKAERQAGRNTFISTHQIQDIGRIKSVLRRSALMVRINPLHAGTAAEVDAVIEQGADRLMLPMFTSAAQLREFCGLVAGRVPVTALLETAGAHESAASWIGTPGLNEVYVGLNDLHLSLGLRFMFEPLALGLLEPIAALAHESRIRFGFGGIARADEGLLPGRDVLAEHLRLGSTAVILSRTFHMQREGESSLEGEIRQLRNAEAALAQRSAQQIAADRSRIAAVILEVASRLRQPGS